MIDTVVFGILLAIGLLFMVFRPVSKFLLKPAYWDISAGTITIIVFLIYVMSAYVSPAMIEEDLSREPCGSNTPQGACYNLERNLCENIWQKMTELCKQELADVIKARPTGLIGPALNRCSARKMDKAVRFNRAHADSAYCHAYFKYLEEK